MPVDFQSKHAPTELVEYVRLEGSERLGCPNVVYRFRVKLWRCLEKTWDRDFTPIQGGKASAKEVAHKLAEHFHKTDQFDTRRK